MIYRKKCWPHCRPMAPKITIIIFTVGPGKARRQRAQRETKNETGFRRHLLFRGSDRPHRRLARTRSSGIVAFGKHGRRHFRCSFGRVRQLLFQSPCRNTAARGETGSSNFGCARISRLADDAKRDVIWTFAARQPLGQRLFAHRLHFDADDARTRLVRDSYPRSSFRAGRFRADATPRKSDHSTKIARVKARAILLLQPSAAESQ